MARLRRSMCVAAVLAMGGVAVRDEAKLKQDPPVEGDELPVDVAPAPTPKVHPGQFPVDILGGFDGFKCELGPLVHRTTCRTLLPGVYQRITDQVDITFNEGLSQHCDDVNCERGDFGGCILRLVGHDLMDFDEETLEGGTDACIDFEDPDNTGLRDCLDGLGEFGKGNTVQNLYGKFCHEVSLADFMVIMAEALMVILRPDWNSTEKRSPTLQWGNFKFGRETKLTCTPKRLPDPLDSCFAVEDNFIKHLGLNWTEAAAFMGVHTLGRARVANSGYDGWWTTGVEGAKFDNEYFVRLLGAGWVPKQVQEDGKFQWVRSDGGPQTEMMLNTDICMLWTTHSGCHAESILDKDCCLWASDFPGFGLQGAESQCVDGCTFNNCCRDNAVNRCGNEHMFPKGSAPAGTESAQAIIDFSKSDEYWLRVFKVAWYKASQKGRHDFFTSECVDAPNVAP